jgi:hypothetical protein
MKSGTKRGGGGRKREQDPDVAAMNAPFTGDELGMSGATETRMNEESLSNVSDAELVARLEALVREKRLVTVAVLLHLAEVEARQLHLRAACSSMYVYCTRVLGMSEDESFKRIRAARAVRRHPVVAAALADGRLHLTGVVLLAPHLTGQNAEELVAAASGRSKVEIEILLARRAPRPDVPERLERVAEQAMLIPDRGPAADEVVLEPPPNVANRLTPLAPERFALQLTIGEATRTKLLRAQGLLRHQVPSGDLSEVLDCVLDKFLHEAERRRFGKTSRPRAAKRSQRKRHVPNEERRRAVARDGLRCSFISEDGRRCEETGFLELDHVVPVALGGNAKDGVRVLCRSHNQFEAERILGRARVKEGKAAKTMDDDLVAGLRRLGVSASDARDAVAASTGPGSLEERMRAALVMLGTMYSSGGGVARCPDPGGASTLAAAFGEVT